MNSYSKSEIKDGFYITTEVVETVISAKEIVHVDDTVFTVLATGAYGQIRVTDGHRYYKMRNPFVWEKDSRLESKEPFLAVCEDTTFSKVLNMTNAIFNLKPEVMANLHSKVFIPRGNKDYWVELTLENLSVCGLKY